MKLFNKVAIVGVGLIGGSLALAIKKKKLANEIIGVSRHKKTLLLAKKRGVIDSGSLDINAVSEADLVILSAPVGAILKLAPLISKVIKPDCIVCDVGSTKQEIVAALDKLFFYYVGAHPLAGSEKRGVLYSKADIFKGSLCILTPTGKTNAQAFLKIKKLWGSVGAKISCLSSVVHDKVVSFISHLPHIAAFSLSRAVPQEYLKFASTGFKDTTRIAVSDTEVWSDIFLSNQQNILKAIDAFQENLSKIKSAIIKKDSKAIDRFLEQAKAKRNRLN